MLTQYVQEFPGFRSVPVIFRLMRIEYFPLRIADDHGRPRCITAITEQLQPRRCAECLHDAKLAGRVIFYILKKLHRCIESVGQAKAVGLRL